MKRLALILVAFALLPLAACSLRQKPSGEDFYAQGQLNFANKEYKAAIENYQEVIDKFPFSPYAEEAETENRPRLLSAEGLRRGDWRARRFPADASDQQEPRARHVLYRDELLRSDGREDQDQGKTVAALKRFQELEQRFPEGSFARVGA